MTPWGITITCPQCGGHVEPVNATTNGLLSVAVVICPHEGCRRQYEITCRLTPFAQPQSTRRSAQRERAGAAA